MSALDVAMLAGVNLAAAAWFGSSKVCAIMGGCDTQTLAEHDAHPVCRAEAAVIGDGFERPVATLSSVRAASIRARSTNSCGVIPVSLTKCRARLRVLIPTTSASDRSVWRPA